jgi:Uma2 family endonuclease
LRSSPTPALRASRRSLSISAPTCPKISTPARPAICPAVMELSWRADDTMKASTKEPDMPKTTISRTSITFEDFCFLVKEGQKADLIDGVIYMASSDNLDGFRLSKWLMGLTDDYVIERDLGEIFGIRIAFRLDIDQSPEPDIGFVKKSRLYLAKRGYFDGPPDAAFEIVSPESVERDYEKKRLQYEEYRVREYWIIDEMEEIVTLLRLNKRGKFQEVRAKDAIYYSDVIDGFWLDPNWLWQSPRPKKSAILEQLLKKAK